MNTRVEQISEDEINSSLISEAGEILRSGGLVAFPTETVYGLGADALQPEASRKIYAAKGRPSDNPLIVHVCRFEDVKKIVSQLPEAAVSLAHTFWPGPLTMILRKNEIVPDATTGGMNTVAIRMPSNKIALALIQAGGGFIAAPSANTSGRPSPTLADHVYEDLKGKIPLILDGGPVGIGIESTIVDLTEESPMILRPGYISRQMLEEVIGPVQVDPGLIAEDSDQRPKAPGMKYKHYAPRADMFLVEGPMDQVINRINEMTRDQLQAGRKVGIIATEESLSNYPQGIVYSLGQRSEEETIAHNLYKILRDFDKSGVDIIYSESFASPQMGQAIMNRMLKAAGHQIINV